MLFPLAGPGVISIYHNFALQGIPASHVIVVESNLTYTTLHAAGSTMDGTYGAQQSASWGDTSDPDVAAFLKATKGSPEDSRDANVATGYSNVMFLYDVAKRVGFANFNAASLTKFMDDKQNTGFHIPLGRSLVTPGPAGFPQVRQPYSQIVQWNGANLNVVTKGTANGWVNGY
jgi:hypothetical protein